MGHCYVRDTGFMVCDKCGNATPDTRTRRCPYHYCVGADLCDKCNAETKFTGKAYHRTTKCDKKHAAFEAEEQKRRDLMNAGVEVRCAAVAIDWTGNDADRVKVWFRTATKKTAYIMRSDVYEAFPLGEPITADQYRKLGELTPTYADSRQTA